LKIDQITVLHRIRVRSAADAIHQNKQLLLKSDVQEPLKLLDTEPSFVWKDSYHKCKSRKTSNDVSNIRLRQITDISMLAVQINLRFII
jgi:hypothetical protein